MQSQSLLPTDEAKTLKFSDISDTSAAGIVSRTVLQSPQMRVVHFDFDAGQELTSHTNRHRALVHMLSGSCEFLFNEQWHTLEAGDFLHMPPSHPHAVRAPFGPFSMLLTLGLTDEAARQEK